MRSESPYTVQSTVETGFFEDSKILRVVRVNEGDSTIVVIPLWSFCFVSLTKYDVVEGDHRPRPLTELLLITLTSFKNFI